MADTATTEGTDLPFLDVTEPGFEADPFSRIEALRAADPRGGRVLRSARGLEVIDQSLAPAVLGDKRLVSPGADHFREQGAGPLLLEFLSEGKLTVMAGAKHSHHRRLLNPPLTLAAVSADRGVYREIANELVDDFVADGACDLVGQFSHQYPVRVLCRALGVPVEDIPVFTQVTLDFALINSHPLGGVLDRIEAALAKLSEYAAELLAERGDGDTFVDQLAGYVRDGSMSEREVVWSLTTLMQAAHYTTRNQTVLVARALIENGLWDRVGADPGLVPAAVEEGLRYYPIIAGITRVATEPGVVVDGIEVGVGEIVRFNPMGAARDAGAYERPEVFDLDRQVDGHHPFGYGRHKCLGQHMARVDMEVAIEVLTERLPGARRTGTEDPVIVGQLWGYDEFHIAFDPQQTRVAPREGRTGDATAEAADG